MIPILIKASLVIIILLAFYKIFLEKESFFSINRMYLLSCLILACTLPFITLPKLVEHQGIVSELLEIQASPKMDVQKKDSLSKEIVEIPQVEKTTDLGIEKTILSDVKESNHSSVSNNSLTESTVVPIEQKTNRSLGFWMMLVYFFGIVILSLNLIGQLGNMIFKILKNKDQIKDEGSVLVNMKGEVEPCSFFNYIFINPASYDFETYEQIIAHEKVHVKKRHTVDLLLAELAVIILWFNPFVWLLRKEVEKNIEFQTDDILVNEKTEEKEDYQLNLVKIATYTKPLAITTNYNQSLIKQRILKMNTQKSNKFSYLKYAFLAPLLFAILLFLNKPVSGFAQSLTLESDALNIETEEKVLAENKKETQATPINQPDIGNEESSNEVFVKEEKDKVIQISNESECREMLEAIRAEDFAKVKELLKSIDPNCIDPNPGYNEVKTERGYWRIQKADSPLFAAARKGNLEIAKLLVAAGGDIKLDGRGEGSVLLTAASYGHLDFVKYLLDGGADLHKKYPNHGTALIAAAENGHLELVKHLVSKGAKVTEQTSNQGTALICASNNGHLETSEFLLSKGAKLNFIAPNQGTPLIGASNNGHLNLVKFLISKGAKVNLLASNQGTPLIAASNNGHVETIDFLIQQGAKVNFNAPNQGTALIAASNNGHVKTIEFLISKGADVNFNSSNQGNALNAAARNGHDEAMEILMSNGAEINTESDGHGSALVAAVRNGNVEVVTKLIERGADVNGQTDGQGSALNTAARNGNNEMIELLLSKGADVNMQNDGQGSALNAAARNGRKNIVELLLAKGADINIQNDGQGSALNAAARNGHIEVVKLLVAKGAEINARTDGQGSALYAAFKNNHTEIVKYLKSKGADDYKVE